MNRYLVLALVIGAFFFASWASGGSVGTSSECENAKCLVSASTSFISILVAGGLLVFLFFYRQQIGGIDREKAIGIWRRFGAFFLDFLFVLMVLSPLAAIPMLVAEAGFTGQFQWSFEREFSRPSDSNYLLPAILVIFLGLYYYFYKHGQLNRPTIGQYVLNYTVVDAGTEGAPQYGKRVLFSFVGLCAWPVSVVLALRKPKKAFWWDKVTNTTVARVSAVNQSVQADQPSADR